MKSLGESEKVQYSRQIMQIGEEGQERLKAAKVFIAGAGGLGCPAALYLAAAGVGEIRIADNDVVELSNLNRQVLYRTEDIGESKTVSAEKNLRALNPSVNIKGYNVMVGEDNALDLVGDADLIVDAMDNFETRFLLNRVAIKKEIPLIHGAINGFDGQVTTIIPGKTPCLRCIFHNAPPSDKFPVLGVTAGIIGSIEANEAIKYLLGMDGLLTGRLLFWNGMDSAMDVIDVERNPDCRECDGLG